MDWIIAFVKRNWKWLLPLLINFVVLVISLFKRKVKVNDIFTSVLLSLPTIINEAEVSGLPGEEKFKIVLSKVFTMLTSLTGLTLKQVMSRYGDQVVDAVEDILSTPQKKGE